jgi:hypothetical protein
MRGQLKNPLRVRRIQRVSLNNPLEQAAQLVLLGQEPLAQLVLLELRDCKVALEQQGQLDCEEARVRLASKALLAVLGQQAPLGLRA